MELFTDLTNVIHAYTYTHTFVLCVCMCMSVYVTFIQNIANTAQSPNHTDFREATSVCKGIKRTVAKAYYREKLISF